MRTRSLAVCMSTILALALYSAFSDAGPPGRSAGSEGARRVGIDYPGATQGSNPATAVTPRVYGSASPDSIPGRYRYTVTLVNEASSRNTIWKFVLDPVPRPITVTPPPNWMWAYGYDLRDRALAFGSEGDDAPYPASWDSVSAVRSIYDLQPGDSVTFRFVSDGTPSMVHFYVQGFNNDSLGTEDQGGPPPYSVYTNSITGAVIGPATTVSVPSTPGPHERPPAPKAPPARSSFVPNRAPARLAFGRE